VTLIFVRSGTEYSSISPILAGVPQGAVASPTLFNLYSADQSTNPNTRIAEYADDKVIYSSQPTGLNFNLSPKPPE